MRLVTIRPRTGAARVAQEADDVRVAILLESGAALTMGALARVAGWSVSGGIDQLTLAELLATDPHFSAIREALEAADAQALQEVAVPPDRFCFGAPIPRPGKIVGVGYNYIDHIREQGLATPTRPVLFSKFATSVTGDGMPIRRPVGTHALDLEAELAIVIGRRASRVSPEAAIDYVAGYTAANDVTARDWQGQPKALRPGETGDGQWLRAKGSDTFLPLGPILVTADDVRVGGSAGTAGSTGRGLRVRSWLTSTDGRLVAGGQATAAEPFFMQDGNTSDLLFGVAELVSIISREVTLDPGDIIITGTPSGVGVFREPQVFLQPGDVVRVEVEGIGSLTNPITDEDGHAPTGSPAAVAMAMWNRPA